MAEARHVRASGDPKLDGKSLIMILPKAVDKAIHAHEKAIKKEHKMAGKLAKATQAHKSAVYNIQESEKAIWVRSKADRRELSNLTVAMN